MTVNRTPAGVPTGGQFAASVKSESGVALATSQAVNGPPPYTVETATGYTIKPGDQVKVRGTDDWAEVDSVSFQEASGSFPERHIAHCIGGYNKGIPAGEAVEVVRGDEHGIPTLTDTIWNAKMDGGYDSGTPERVEWCDECAEYEGASTSRDAGPTRELCHGCEDRRINEYVSNGGNL